jgi:NAD(P)-dependent dehydrogenase (short-subunit alcohol dehydrogenase family)
VVIAGGTSGVGLAAARGLAAAGAPALLLLGRNPERGRAAAASIAAAHVGFLATDATDARACEAAVEHAVSSMGGIDVLITAVASREFPELLMRTSVGDVQRIINSHMLPAVLMTTAALPVMSAQPQGASVINVASDAGKSPTPGESLIGAAMAAIIMFTRTVALEGKRSGVRANAVTPSLIVGTPSGEALLEADFAGKLFAKAKTQADLGLTTPEDLTPLIVYLAGPDSAKMTGQAISLNGGISIT